jgi:nucleoid-associated protein YgaU
MGRETKIGLTLIIILVSAFGFVVFKKLKDQRADVAQQIDQPLGGEDANPTEGDAELTQSFAQAGTVRPIAHVPAVPDQNEPGDPFSAGEGESTAITADVPAKSIPNSEPRPLLDLSDEPTDEPAVRRPIGNARDLANQSETEFGLAEEPAKPARSAAIEITNTEPMEINAAEVGNSLPVLDSTRTTTPLRSVESQPVQPEQRRSPPSLSASRGPAIVLSPPEATVDSNGAPSEQLDGFEVAMSRRANTVVTADDERLDGFREVPLDGRRAFAQTRVERPAPVLASATSGAVAADRATAASTELTPILPKRGASAARATDPFESQPTEQIVRKASTPQRVASDSSGNRSRSATLASETNPDAGTYTIQPNDNFWNISRRQYGTGRYFQALARYNADRVPDPAQMKPGQQIATPPRAVLEQQFAQLIETSGSRVASEPARPAPTTGDSDGSGFFVDAGGQPFYRVGPDDTLTGISQRHLGRASRWTEIYDRNTDQLTTADALKIGTILRLPPDATQVRIVQEPSARR